MKRASAIEDLQPLLKLCRAGKLFEIQEWVKQGNPIALPKDASGRLASLNPLRVVMNDGFHSLVRVLLEAGAPVCEGHYSALDHAVTMRRADLAALLFEHGATAADVPMRLVIDMWQPEMVELFLTKGASLTDGNPVAWGLIHKVRPTLGLLKRFGAEQPALMKQANIALRFHAADGNAKWVALLLWAGADPWSRGPDHVETDDSEDDDGGLNAVEFAVIRGKLDVLAQKRFVAPPDPQRPETLRVLEDACHGSSSEVLSLLFERGHSPRLLQDRGTGAINALLSSMSWIRPSHYSLARGSQDSSRGIDSNGSREHMKMLHMLVAAGAKWLPADKYSLGRARQYLLKMAPQYALEFAWLMKEYGAARRRDVEKLFRTPAMVRLISKEREQADALVAAIADEPLETPAESSPVIGRS